MSFNLEWQTSKLEEVLDALIDYRGKTPKKTNEGIPLITAKIVKNGAILSPQEFIDEKDYDTWMVRGLPKAGDVVLTTEAPLGEVAQLTNSNVALAQRIVTLRGKANVLDNGFLKYFLMSNIGQSRLKERESGTTVTGIKQSELRLIEIDIPNFETQQGISKILESIEHKLELNIVINKNLEEMAQALFKRWFVDFEFPNENGESYKSSGGEFEESELGLIPKRWKVGTTTDIFDVQSGGTPKTGNSDYWNGDIPFFTPKDSTDSYYVIDTEKKITSEGLSKCNSKLYKIGTVFITARGTVGKLAIAGRDMAMNQSCYALVSKNGFTQKFVFLQTQQFISTIKKNATGAVFDAITVSTFQSLKTVIPDIELVSQFDKLVEGIFLSVLNNADENQVLSNARDSLLPKLMSGEIRVPKVQDYTPAFEMPMAAESSERYTTNI